MSEPRHRRLAVGIDIGGTSFKVALTDGKLVHARVDGPTGPGRNPVDVVAHLADAVATVCRTVPDDATVAGVGIGAPGHVDSVAGTVDAAINLGWSNVPLAELIESATGLPSVVEHDAYLGAIAEFWCGSHVPSGGHLLYVPIGTGVSCALISGDCAWRGGRGFAGEIGLGMLGDGRRVEHVVAGPALSQSYAARTGRTLSAKNIVALTEVDHDARHVWEDFIASLATVLWNSIVLTDPDVVVLSGGLSLAADALLAPLSAEISALAHIARPTPPIRLSTHGVDAGCLGAGLYALRALALAESGGHPGPEGSA